MGPVSNASLHLHNISSLFKYFKRKGNEKSQIRIAYEIPRENFFLKFHQDPFWQSLPCPLIIIITVNLQIFCLQIYSRGHCKFSPRNIPPTCYIIFRAESNFEQLLDHVYTEVFLLKTATFVVDAPFVCMRKMKTNATFIFESAILKCKQGNTFF